MLTIKCDKCGNYCVSSDEHIRHDYAEIKFNFGYETILDGAHGTYHLCDICFKEMVNMMRLPKSEDWPMEEEQ